MTYRDCLGEHLDDLLASRFLPKRWAARLQDAADLPARLERCVGMLRPDCEWRAYGTGDDIVFAVARERYGGLQSRAAASLEVYFLDREAAVYSAGVWEHDGTHGWWLDSIVERSYDEEHGWWLGAVIGQRALAVHAEARPRCPVALLRSVPEAPLRALPAPRQLGAARTRGAPRRR
jgi:hypothetical protein